VRNPRGLIGVFVRFERSAGRKRRTDLQDVFGNLFRDPSETMVQKCWRSARKLMTLSWII
jgi:hypothetical protein